MCWSTGPRDRLYSESRLSLFPPLPPAIPMNMVMDSSEVGLYGTLRLVKRLDPQSTVASFPIDDDTVSFGRDPNCSVRLYYLSISAVHVKIVFQERKVHVWVVGVLFWAWVVV